MKKTNLKVFLLCPIPNDQKPINEYIEWKQNSLNIFSKFENEKTFYRFGIRDLFFFLIATIFTTLPTKDNLFHWFFETSTLGSIITIIYLIIQLNRWLSLRQKFIQSRIFYEEASWFDGQFWEKPFFLIKNDQLISTQKIEPIIEEFKYILSIRFILTIFISLPLLSLF